MRCLDSSLYRAVAARAGQQQQQRLAAGRPRPCCQPCLLAAETSVRRHRGSRLQAMAAAATAATTPAPPPPSPLVYSGVVFDMDGTLTVPRKHDYAEMRELLDIPVGDVFTVLESWDDGDAIKRSMDTIIQLEEKTCTTVQPMPGLLDLLAFLRASGCKVGIVTRNTTASLDAFFQIVGEEWRAVFDIVLTRDNTPYVKPDKRCLLHFAEAWAVPPHQLLMVGDSSDDIETACAAGTASCLIAGGGSETSADAVAPPMLGGVPTFTVDSLSHLQQRLAAGDTELGWAARGSTSSSGSLLSSLSSSSSDSDHDSSSSSGRGGASELSMLSMAGAPPAGLDFLDALFALGAVQAASCSFPRVDSARFGVPPDAHPGSRVLHLACGNGALTKLLFAAGLQVIGVDEDVVEARRRGLTAVQLAPLVLGAGALQPELATMGGALFDAVVFYQAPTASNGVSSSSRCSGSSGSPTAAAAQDPSAAACGLAGSWWRQESLAELRRVVKPGGRLCVQAPVADEDAVRRELAGAGFKVLAWDPAGEGACRLVAEA